MRPHELKATGTVLCHVDEYVDGHWTTILTTRDEPFADQLAEGLGRFGRVQKITEAARQTARAKRKARGKI